MKTSELTCAALDWAAAKCEGYQSVYTNGSLCPVFRKCEAVEATWPSYSTDWSQGGPIIEREGITLERFKNSNKWSAFMFSTGDCEMSCDTPLIAAMRCYVASKLGDNIDIPKELL